MILITLVTVFINTNPFKFTHMPSPHFMILIRDLFCNKFFLFLSLFFLLDDTLFAFYYKHNLRNTKHINLFQISINKQEVMIMRKLIEVLTNVWNPQNIYN